MRVDYYGDMDANCPTLPLQGYSTVTETVTASSLPLTASFPALTASSLPVTPIAGSSAALYHCSAQYCPDNDSDGVSSPHYSNCILDEEQDCNDANDAIHGRATETCDGFDNDCDGLLDEGCDGQCDEPENLDSDTRITNTGGISQKASLAWMGNGYGIAWQDDRNGNEDIYFARLDASGARITGELPVTTEAATSQQTRLAWNGREFGVAWQDDRNGNWEIYFNRLDSSGGLLGSDIRVTDDSANSFDIGELVWAGTEYGLIWRDRRDGNWEIYFTRLDESGDKIGGDIRISNNASYSSEVSIVWTGEGYGVAWIDNPDGNWDILFALLDRVGSVVHEERVTTDPGDSRFPTVAWSGSEFGIAWNDDRDGNDEIYFVRLDADGYKIGAESRITADSAGSDKPWLAWSGEEWGVAWHDTRHGYSEIYFQRIDTSGAPWGSDVRVTDDNYGSDQPSLVWNGARYAMAWHDWRDTDWEIYFAHLDCCDDTDSDGWSECHECDDSDFATNPGATEICDWQDNNCDDVIDEGFPFPGVTTGLSIGADKQTWTWDSEPVADRYDIVKGDLEAVLGQGGDYYQTVMSCLEDDSGDTSAPDVMTPNPGKYWYYLVRAVADCKVGTYDSGAQSQSGSRNDDLQGATYSCP
jgi:hypothetical protein